MYIVFDSIYIKLPENENYVIVTGRLVLREKQEGGITKEVRKLLEVENTLIALIVVTVSRVYT